MGDGLTDLMNLYWSTAGLALGGGEISPIDFEIRVKSAAKAGFVGIGLWHTDLEHILIHRTLAEVRAILGDNGMRHLELEFLTDWFVGGARRGESDNRRKRLLDASAALGAHHVKVGDFYNTPASMAQLVDSFGELCRDAARYGATIGFEFMGSAMLANLADSLAMVEGAGADNGGIIVDIAHATALGISNDAIRAIPAKCLICVELNDNLLPSTAGYAPGERRFCGEGEFDIAGFVAAIEATGYTGPWALEVFSHKPPTLMPDEASRRGYDTLRAAVGA
jgi:sugar phosphate isomerase/epimerase